MTTDKLPDKAVIKENAPAGGAQRKPYHSPLLTTYGHISKLTMSNAGTGNDGSSKWSKRRMACL